MSNLIDAESTPSPIARSDVVDVIDRAAHIENIINQVIVGYCKPRKEAWEFMWNIVLDTSVMSLGGKVKVVMAVSHEMGFNLDKDSLHKVISLRNSFAHNANDAHPVFVVGRTPTEDTSHLQFLVLESSGKITRIKRQEAFIKFSRAYDAARESLVQLKNLIDGRYKGSNA